MRMLMVSTEYPPLNGGVGRYTSNLAHHLRSLASKFSLPATKRQKASFQELLREIS